MKLRLHTRHGCYWFISGMLSALVILLLMRARDIVGLTHEDMFAALVLAILATVQFGVIIPITCIVFRYKSEQYNFYHALLLLLGFTIGTGGILAWHGAYVLASLYVVASCVFLCAFYKITYILHRHILEPPNKNQ